MIEKERETPQQHNQEIVKTINEEAEFKPPKEIEQWIEKIEKDPVLAQPILDDQGQVLVTSSQATNPKVVIPFKKNEFVLALKAGVTEAIRWFAEWWYRLIKIEPRKVKFEEGS